MIFLFDMCVSPLTIVRKNGALGHRSYLVPCGICSECIKKKSTSWGIRAYREFLASQKQGFRTLFVTITYDNDHLPHTKLGNATLDRNAITLFLKRVRSYLFYHYDVNIRFLCSAEYGSKTFRPHYHFLFHGLPRHLSCTQFKNIIKSLWRSCSRLKVEVPRNDSSGGFYCGKYCGKSVTQRARMLKKEDPHFVTPFKRASLGYGNNFSLAEKNYYLAADFQDEFKLSTDPFAVDNSFAVEYMNKYFREVTFFDSDKYKFDYNKLYQSLLRRRDPSKFCAWFNVVFKRFFECHRPKKDGSYVNVQFPEYLAKKLYGDDLFKALKLHLQKLHEKFESECCDPFNALFVSDSPAYEFYRQFVDDYKNGTNKFFVNGFGDFQGYVLNKLHYRDDLPLRVLNEKYNLQKLYINDVF